MKLHPWRNYICVELAVKRWALRSPTRWGRKTWRSECTPSFEEVNESPKDWKIHKAEYVTHKITLACTNTHINMIISRPYVEWWSPKAKCEAKRLIGPEGRLESRPWRVSHAWHKADITLQTEYMYKYLNYTTAGIHHRYTIHTVLGTRPHTIQVHSL